MKGFVLGKISSELTSFKIKDDIVETEYELDSKGPALKYELLPSDDTLHRLVEQGTYVPKTVDRLDGAPTWRSAGVFVFHEVQDGDLVTILDSSHLAFILRPAHSEGPNRWKIISVGWYFYHAISDAHLAILEAHTPAFAQKWVKKHTKLEQHICRYHVFDALHWIPEHAHEVFFELGKNGDEHGPDSTVKSCFRLPRDPMPEAWVEFTRRVWWHISDQKARQYTRNYEPFDTHEFILV